MFDPLYYKTKTQETILLGITHYDYLLEWCNDDPERAYHLLNVFYDRDVTLENIVGSHIEYAYIYAIFVLEDRFVLGEESISKDGEYAYWYARYSLKAPFPLGEEAILNSKYKDQYLSLTNRG